MSQFRDYVINQFCYLEQWGYRVIGGEDANLVSYKGETSSIEITFSTIGYELTCQFIDNANHYFSLQDALEYETLDYKGLYQIVSKKDMEKGISYLSCVVRTLLEKINISEPLNFQTIYQFRMDTHEKMLENYYLETDLKKAEIFWKKKEYTKAKELFEKDIEHLSLSQQKKLEYIKNRSVL